MRVSRPAPAPVSMRATSLLRTILALQDTVVTGCEFTPEALIVDVKPTWRVGRCSECHRKAPSYDRRCRKWRHLDLGGIKTFLRYELRRVECRRCGIKVGPASVLSFQAHQLSVRGFRPAARQ